MEESSTVKKIKCPICHKPTIFATENPFRPFCSERCRTNDLGAWASEAYKAPTTEHADFDQNKTDDEDNN